MTPRAAWLLAGLLPLLALTGSSATRAAGDKAADAHADAAYARRVAALKKRAPAGFAVVVEKPFVVVSDLSRKELSRRAHHTIRWTRNQLRALYFDKDPDHIVDVWLFNGKRSYERNVARLWGEEPDTPYGWYSPSKNALIMNIATGGGTLIHELVHPFVEANFPAAPPWLNEGLGSLYEHAGERDGRLIGKLNWRLPILQEALREGPIPSFETLMAQDEDGFYERDPGTNYAQARYLCYWLQERGLLVKLYREMHAHQARDPTGYQTFLRVVGTDDAAAWQRDWERWALGLRR